MWSEEGISTRESRRMRSEVAGRMLRKTQRHTYRVWLSIETCRHQGSPRRQQPIPHSSAHSVNESHDRTQANRSSFNPITEPRISLGCFENMSSDFLGFLVTLSWCHCTDEGGHAVCGRIRTATSHLYCRYLLMAKAGDGTARFPCHLSKTSADSSF